jgi:cbb3-type cytochrome oxidase maturation protein
MNILYLLVPVALLLAGAGVAAFWWAVRSGQFDDVETPAIRVLLDEGHAASPHQPQAEEPSARRGLAGRQ